MSNEPLDLETYQMADEMMRIFRSAVSKAQAESRRLGVPNVYSMNGHIYYEMPNGDYVRELPDNSDTQNGSQSDKPSEGN